MSDPSDMEWALSSEILPLDLLVIGGGVNGCAIARDAAGRGMRVVLCEMGDLASGTSSKSTKLIHGGLRYLEHFKFKLVRESLIEREILMQMAPHIVRPMRFVLPHNAQNRPAWLLRTGLFLYDTIGGRKELPPTQALNLQLDEAGGALHPNFTKGFEYSDCWVDDSRLVVLTAMDAAARGAEIFTRTKVVQAQRRGEVWAVEVHDLVARKAYTIYAKTLINAAGPWVDDILGNKLGEELKQGVRLVQGTHIVVPKRFEHDRSYLFQNADGRILFAIPFENDFTLIGTTDKEFAGNPQNLAPPADSIKYLCDAANQYFAKPITPEHVIWAYTGLRPLFYDGTAEAQEATRDYQLSLSARRDGPRVLSVYGGKITTHRKLAEEALGLLAQNHLAPAMQWTAGSKLPGADFGYLNCAEFAKRLAEEFGFLSMDWATRLATAYGTNAYKILNRARSAADLGFFFGANLHAAEVDYLVQNEWARSANDVLWRRSKLGLRLTEPQVERLQHYISSRAGRAKA